MLKILRKILPESIKKYLRILRVRFYDPYYKRRLSEKMSHKHSSLLLSLKDKSKIRVVFLVYTASIWKVDTVFKKMLADSLFDPIILIYPNTLTNKVSAFLDMKNAYDYFASKGYPVISSYNDVTQTWRTLAELKTDIVFFSDPSALPLNEYYEHAYLNYLSCYCGYGYIVTDTPGKNIENHDLYLHNALWRNYVTDKYAMSNFAKLSTNKGANTLLTGFPNIESLLSNDLTQKSWTSNDNRLRIIYAPHHSIEAGREYWLSNFLKLAVFFQKMAIKYERDVVWCFKPHPTLESKLYDHPDWGKEKTDDYYSFWQNQSNTQYHNSNYIDLFKGSDAMIHDSGTFLIEYLTQKKPVLYLVSENTRKGLNNLAKRALNACQHATNEEEIEKFITDLLEGSKAITEEHKQFYKEEFEELYRDEQPSDRIISDIKNKIFNLGKR